MEAQLKHFLTIAALIAAFLVPSTAQAAAGTTDQCAIGFTGDDRFYPFFPIIRVYGSTPAAAEVNVAAAVCTDLITTGEWKGVSKYRADWDHDYAPVCFITRPADPGVSLMVWRDNTRPDSLAVGLDDCDTFHEDAAFRVTYY